MGAAADSPGDTGEVLEQQESPKQQLAGLAIQIKNEESYNAGHVSRADGTWKSGSHQCTV